MAARVSKDNFEAEVLQASIPVLVEFYSEQTDVTDSWRYRR